MDNAVTPDKKEKKHYTYADYLTWDTDDRYEIIDGESYLMSPSPLYGHQAVVLELGAEFRRQLSGKNCVTLVAPFDVRLNADTRDDTVVQPDVFIVCDRGKIERRSLKGAPDLVVEVLSSSTRAYDSMAKLNRYMKAGVRECWLVDPEVCVVMVYTKNAAGKLKVEEYGENDVITASILPDLQISLREVFAATRL